MKSLALLLLGVVLVNGGVLKTSREIQEYREFLERTVDGQAEEPLNPELALLQNPEERSGKFQGDIVLSHDQIDAMVDDFAGKRNALLNTKKLWTYKTVYYKITNSHFTSAQISAIKAALKEIEKVSCIRFKAATSSTKNFITVTGKKTGCHSKVGMGGGSQNLNLQPSTVGSGCFRPGTIIHELLHALGFYHMQSSHNRDDFVRIVWAKIQAGKEHNFNKYSNTQVTNFNTGYDFGSVLHYSQYGFSIDGSKTIVPRQATSETIGQRTKMSTKDIKKLKSLYKC